MNRRQFLQQAVFTTAMSASLCKKAFAGAADFESATNASVPLGAALRKDWLLVWEKNILETSSVNRYCDSELGEELGWLMSPFLNGFYYGFQATRDLKWVEHFADWADSWIKRGVKEPDNFIGWPKDSSVGPQSETVLSDSLLGEAMAMRPLVLMSGEIQKTPALQDKFRTRAKAWLELAEATFTKWDSRGCWREVNAGGLWVVPAFGIDQKTKSWTEGYFRRHKGGFSNPGNKQNHIAQWMLALHDVTGKQIYRERAEKWFRLMKSRIKTRKGTSYLVWNYWDPAGPWDYQSDGSPRHWVGVHPNGGYYSIDVEGIIAAYEHKLVFSRDDVQQLIATNRDFMWNQHLKDAKFQRIDGGEVDNRWKDSPGVLWNSLIPYDETLRKIFIGNHNPAGWGGLASTPWFLVREKNA